MKLKYMRITAPISPAGLLIAVMLLTVSCRKEKAPDPSDLDQNYFVIEDNPHDPIDHAIYEFYKSTDIACFYNDTIYKKKVSRENEDPARYSYIKLSLDYSPLSDNWVHTIPLSSREKIPALLTLMKEEVVPRLPPTRLFPSILLLDSFTTYIISDIQLSQGWSAMHGFNTLGIKVKDVEAISPADRKMYAASILAGIAEKRINALMSERIKKDFLSITREASKALFPFEADIYLGIPFMYLFPPGTEPAPAELGLLFYPTFHFEGTPLPNMPTEADDIRGFLTAVFCYNEQEFAGLHPGETLLLKKFSIMRNFVKEAGFKPAE